MNKTNHLGFAPSNPWLHKHGHRLKSKTSPTYISWSSMKSRCNDKSNPNYGGAGIYYCERWEVFQNFLSDMGERPDGCTIDRINPKLGYSPDNCRWANSRVQAVNRSNTNLVEINGEKLTLVEFSRKYGIPTTTIYRRYKQGVRGSKLLSSKNRNSMRSGEKAPSSKLKIKQVARIRELLNQGCKIVEIACQYGVSTATICDIKSGRTWRQSSTDHYEDEAFNQIGK